MRQALTGAHYTLLGLLLQQPAHGYDLLRRLKQQTAAARVIPLKAASLYAALHELESQGLIVGQTVVDTAYPPRTFFEPTQAGRQRFSAWLAEPVERLREVRSDFLLKVYFAGTLALDGGAGLVERQIEILAGYVRNMEDEMLAAGNDSFDYLVAESKLTAAQGTLAWLQKYRIRLLGTSESKRSEELKSDPYRELN